MDIFFNDNPGPPAEAVHVAGAAWPTVEKIVVDMVTVTVYLKAAVSASGVILNDIVMDIHVPVVVFHIDGVVEMVVTTQALK
jgi:hypothetical protein